MGQKSSSCHRLRPPSVKFDAICYLTILTVLMIIRFFFLDPQTSKSLQTLPSPSAHNPSCELYFDSALVIGMRGSGLKTLLEGIAYPVFGTQSKGRTALLQGGSATTERIQRLLGKAQKTSMTRHQSGTPLLSPTLKYKPGPPLRSTSTIVMTAVRQPIDRIINRYWFEGRWPQHSRVRGESDAMAIEDWIERVRRQNDRDNPSRKGYFWQCVDNYYTAVLSGSTLPYQLRRQQAHQEVEYRAAIAAVDGGLVTPGFAFALELLSHPRTLQYIKRQLLCACIARTSSGEFFHRLEDGKQICEVRVSGTNSAKITDNATLAELSVAPKRAAGGPRVPKNYILPKDLHEQLLSANDADMRLWSYIKTSHKKRIGL